MKRSIGALGAATVLVLTLTGAAQADTKAAAPNAPVAASTDARSAGAQALPGRFYVDGANIRRSANLNATIVGLGYRSHSVTVHCGTTGPLETYWWRITNNTTGVTGYIEQSVGGPSSNPGSC